MITSRSNRLGRGAMLLALSLSAACGLPGSNPVVAPIPPSPPSPPTVTSTSPLNGASDVPITGSVNATFSRAMDPATLTQASFSLTSGAVVVPGTVTYADSTVAFWPAAPLQVGGAYTATITTAATSASGDALATRLVWTFNTSAAVVVPKQGVDLGLAGGYAVLAKSGVSSVPPSSITGRLGLSPAAASYLTGFSLAADASNVFSTSSQVIGKVYAANYAVPTPSSLTTAVLDMQLAYSDAAGRTAGTTGLGAGNVDRKVLAPGVYRWSSDVMVPTVVTLSGSATDVWILQVAGNLSMGNGSLIRLIGGARASNITWQVAGLVDLGMRSHAEGTFLSRSSITVATDAVVIGRLLAQTAVTLDHATIIEPTP
jgi:hypothetical protein